MGDEWKEGPDPDPDTQSARPSQDDLDKRIEEIRRKVIDTAAAAPANQCRGRTYSSPGQ